MGCAEMDSLLRIEVVMKRIFLSFILAAVMVGCASGKCLQANTQAAASAANPGAHAKDTMKPASKLDRVKVYKADGSLQCGQGKSIAAAEMQKELGDIKVYSTATKNDGMMRIQVCGSPTGNANVFEIDRSNLEAAVQKGFKEWTFDN
jgi:hypothetical protein